jgi:hypothetical protein
MSKQSRPAYDYVDTAFGGANNRNNVMSLSALDAKLRSINDTPDCFKTVLRFTEELKDYAATNPSPKTGKPPSVSRFPGPAFASFVPEDLDCKDNPTTALRDARILLQRLEADYDVPAEALWIFFSGLKGFAIELPAALFGGFDPSPEIGDVIKAIASSLATGLKTFDPSVYDKLHLWRIPNTKHGESGLYKIPLKRREIFHFDIHRIRRWAESPRSDLWLPDEEQLKPVPALVSMRNEALRERTSQSSSAEDNGGENGMSRPISIVRPRLKGVQASGSGYTAHCPAHDDRTPSLHVTEGDDGRVLLKCFAGCRTETIVRRIGLEMKDLFPRDPSPRTEQPARSNGPKGLSLTEYATAKKLPQHFLETVGLSTIYLGGRPVVRMPYLGDDGTESSVRFRVALDGENRFRWKSGSKTCPYGLWKLKDARRARHVTLVEGESDTQTLWYHDQPALGIPGAEMREEWTSFFDGIDRIYVVVEPDRGGETLRESVAKSRIRDRVHFVTLPRDAKDPSALHLLSSDKFDRRWQGALKSAVPWTEAQSVEREAERAAAWARCKRLARDSDILQKFTDELASRGIVGEQRTTKVVYLALTSRVLDRPISIAVKGPTSAGKSKIVEETLKFFPESAYIALSAMSERSLVYDDEPISHRMLVLFEAAGLSSEFGNYLMRSLLSEGRLKYKTVIDGKGVTFEREGPTGLIVTTTLTSLHLENETRILSLPVTDTPEQTKRIIESLARPLSPKPIGEEWHALQELISSSDVRVSIPYADHLSKLTKPLAVRLRRDFGMILNLIRTHAILHQASRERNADGEIVATIDDYRAIRDLVADLVAEGVGATVAPIVRETVKAVSRLVGDGRDEVTISEVAKELKLDVSPTSRRVKMAIAKGYLKNRETKPRQPARLVPGEELPEEIEILPTAERLLGNGDPTFAMEMGEEPSPPPPSSKPGQSERGGEGEGSSQSSYKRKSRSWWAERIGANLRRQEEIYRRSRWGPSGPADDDDLSEWDNVSGPGPSDEDPQ